MDDDATPRSARGVYGISVASELSGIGPQTLRLYERWGLIAPSRTAGGTRRYSDEDLDRLKRITELVNEGINLAGAARILDLESRNSQLESDKSRLQSDNSKLRTNQRIANAKARTKKRPDDGIDGGVRTDGRKAGS